MNTKKITLEDCKELHKRFQEYAEEAEQYQFAFLAMVETKIISTIESYEHGCEIDQQDARAMFRSVLKIIHQDYSMYEEKLYK